VFTDDDELADKIRSIRIHGKGSSRYDNIRIGLNSRLDTLQAAILQVKFQAFVEYELDNVNKIAQSYTEKLKDTVKTPIIPHGYYSSWAQYTIQLESKEQRDALQEKLREQGIPTMIYYPKPMHCQKAFSNVICLKSDTSTTERLCERILSLPIHPYLEEDDNEKICRVITRTIDERGIRG
jgi:dTDP-4-amino-4,6-dideoxygalactose transaminase